MEIARLLLEHSADPNTATTGKGSTALILASVKGHVEIARLLLEHSADTNIATTDEGLTALIFASQNGHVEVARLLFEHGADPNTAKTDGHTALILASGNGHVEVARLLLEHSADPNTATTDDGDTALIFASAGGHMRVALLLAAHGAALAHVHNYGHTAQQTTSSEEHGQLAAVADHAPIRIAVGCRMHGEARSALRTGVLGDPTLCTLKEIMHAATGTGLWGADLELPPVCRATTRLARDAMACWSPERHWLFHGRVRNAIHTVLLVQERLNRMIEDTVTGVVCPFPYLPVELWFYICSMLLRRDWAAWPW